MRNRLFHRLVIALVLGVVALVAGAREQEVVARPLGTEVSGTISEDTVWGMDGSPYVLTGGLTIAANATLTVEAGIEVYGNTLSYISVVGTLVIQGTASQPVIFTSARPAEERQPGDWAGLLIQNGSHTTLDHAVVEYAGQYLNGYGGQGIYINSSDITIRNSFIRYNRGHGIITYQSATIIDSTIHDNGGRGLYVAGSGGTLLENSTIRDNDYGVAVLAPDVTIRNSLITSNTNESLTIDSSYLASMTAHNMSLTNNGRDGILLSGSLGNGSFIWPTWLREHHLFLRQFTLLHDATLTIPAGITLHMESISGSPAYISVVGTLVTEGTASQPVIFTSARPAEERQPGDWVGLLIQNGSHTTLDHTIVEYAGARLSGYSDQGIYINSSDITIRNSFIRYNRGHGILTYQKFSLEDSAIYENSTGIESHVSFSIPPGNAIFDNDIGAVTSGTDTKVIAHFVWWGSVSGPYHPNKNADGLGNSVDDGISFSSWVWSPPAMVNQIEELLLDSPIAFTTAPYSYHCFKINVNTGEELVISLDVADESVIQLSAYISQQNCAHRESALKGTSTDHTGGYAALSIGETSTTEYFVRVESLLHTDAVDVTLEAKYSGLDIIAVSPNRGSNTGNLTVEIQGTDLLGVTDATLIGPSNQRISSEEIVLVSDDEMALTFNLEDADIANYTLELIGGATGEKVASKAGAIEVFHGSKGRLKLEIRSPSILSVDKSYKLSYTNIGDNDLDAPFVRIQVSGASTEYPIISQGYRDSEKMEWLASGTGLRGDVLAPGEHGEIKFQINLGLFDTGKLVASIVKGDDNYFDWEAVRNSLPPDIAICQSIWNNIDVSLGRTNKEVLAKLRNSNQVPSGEERNNFSSLLISALQVIELQQPNECSDPAEENICRESYNKRYSVRDYDDNALRTDVRLYTILSTLTATGTAYSVVDIEENFEPDRPAIFITHGRTDCIENPKLQKIAYELKKEYPQTNIVLVGWPNSANLPLESECNEFSCTRLVSRRIPLVANRVITILKGLYFSQWNRTTYIGHSFGNAVNAYISAGAPKQGRSLLLNTASANGFAFGLMPNYKDSFRQSIAVYTNSLADIGPPKLQATTILGHIDPDCDGRNCIFTLDINKKHRLMHDNGPLALACFLTENRETSDMQCGTIATQKRQQLALPLINLDYLTLGTSPNAVYGTLYSAGEIHFGGLLLCDTYPLQNLRSCLARTGIQAVLRSDKKLEYDIVQNYEPNSTASPTGIGEQQIVAADSTLNYSINFANTQAIATASAANIDIFQATSTAPVQELLITSQLDPNLDWSTFRLTSIGYGAHILPIDVEPGTFQYNLQDYPPASVLTGTTDEGIRVDISAQLNPQTGRLDLYFRVVDDVTNDFPSDPAIGLLPVEDGSGRGSGFVMFSAMPKPDLVSGTVIKNKATILFNDNEPIETNEVFNTVDETVDLVLQATSPISIMAGQPITTLFTLINDGPNTAQSINFTYTLPTSATLVTVTASQGNCADITCNLGLINNDERATITVVIQANEEGVLTSQGHVNASTVELNPVDNDATTTIEVIGANEPQITLIGNNTIPNGDTTPDPADGTDFGSATINDAPITHSFTIGNSGSADLTTITVNLTGADAFSLVAAPPTTIAANGQGNFTIAFAPTTAGLYTATVSISSNDSDANPYTFAIQGKGLVAHTATFTLTPGWNLITVPYAVPTVTNAAALAAHIDQSGGLAAILKWNPATQSFRFFAPPNTGDNFAVSIGDTIFLYLNTGAFARVTFAGNVTPVQFTLIPGGYNFLSLPFDRSDLTSAAAVAADIGSVQAMLTWNATTQSFRFFAPPNAGDNFALTPGDSFIVLVAQDGPTRWPDTGSQAMPATPISRDALDLTNIHPSEGIPTQREENRAYQLWLPMIIHESHP